MQKRGECYRRPKCQKKFCEDEKNALLENDEDVFRIFLHPEHYDLKTNRIEAAAFKKQELLNRGCSVDRVALLSTLEEYQKIIDDFVEVRRKNPRHGVEPPQFAYVYKLNVARVRGLHEGLFFCPSSHKARLSHADIWCLPLQPAQLNDVRDMLAKVGVLGCPAEFLAGE